MIGAGRGYDSIDISASDVIRSPKFRSPVRRINPFATFAGGCLNALTLAGLAIISFA